ncbi:MAG: TonB-dependent receptor [Gemmatimonadaceae bacterium]|nr:TonB-dependent receptor [Gemmatimonadaceae bacterium]NUQ91284.1 TonB-dependent receptor [Gemmatimonadaceae bacterium]NUR21066.1 TonB-dependent receptor [Gemmatimonadaceae bacterium]
MAGALLAPALAAAQDTAAHRDTTAFELGQVTVIGVATPQLPVSLSTTLLRGDQLREAPGAPLGRAIAQIPGVRVLSTGPQVSKPVIRGLSGPRVLVADAGHRIEDYSWSEEDAPSADVALAGEVQVTRGPASLRYGSDALGGVVNIVPLPLPTAPLARSALRPMLQVDGATNNKSFGGLARFEGFGNGIGWRVAGSGRFAGDYSAPRGEVPHTGFAEANAEAALGRVGAHGVTTLRLAHTGGEYQLIEAGAPPPAAGAREEGPERKSLDDRLQLAHELPLGGGASLALRGQLQRHSLVEMSDECGQPSCPPVTPGQEQVAFDLLLNTATAEAALQHTLGSAVRGTLGLSTLVQKSRSAGPVLLVPTATGSANGIFLIEEAALSRLVLSGGARVDRRTIDPGTKDLVPVYPAPPSELRRRSWSATSADVGATLAVAGPLSLAANHGTAWRAPTLFELYANGPHLAESRYEIGDSRLDAERSHESDVSLRWRGNVVRAELTAFRNDVDDFIYVAPTGATVNGLRVFEHRSTDARLDGGEAAIDVALGGRGLLRARHEIVRGTDRRAGEPLPLVAPARTMVGAQLGAGLFAHAPRLSVDVTHVARQTRPNPDDIVTDAYTTLDLGAGWGFGASLPWYGASPVAVDLLVRNATNVSYRDFLGRYKELADEPGRNLVLRVTLAR